MKLKSKSIDDLSVTELICELANLAGDVEKVRQAMCSVGQRENPIRLESLIREILKQKG